MEIDKKKLKRRATIGDKLDLAPAMGMVISLFGVGIFYNLLRARAFIVFFDAVFLLLFAIVFVVSFVLYGVGKICRHSAHKMIFNYVDQTARGVAPDICRGEDAEITLNLNIKKPNITFTLASGGVNAVCDLTAASKLATSATLFVDICLGVIAEKVSGDIADGKKYNNVSYKIIIKGEELPTQYLVQGGAANTDALENAARIYKKRAKKYKKQITPRRSGL